MAIKLHIPISFESKVKQRNVEQLVNVHSLIKRAVQSLCLAARCKSRLPNIRFLASNSDGLTSYRPCVPKALQEFFLYSLVRAAIFFFFKQKYSIISYIYIPELHRTQFHPVDRIGRRFSRNSPQLYGRPRNRTIEFACFV